MAQASARHILVENEDICQELKEKIVEGEDFSLVAKEHSKCPSGKSGGELGTFGPGRALSRAAAPGLWDFPDR